MADASSVVAGASSGAVAGTAVSPGVGTVIGAVLGAGASLLSSWLSSSTSESLNSKNLKFQREQFDYMKYLNNNQFQIMSSDAQKAGINPLAMTGGNLQSSSFSGSSVQSDYSSIGNISNVVTSLINSKTQTEIANANNKTQTEIADSHSKQQQPLIDVEVAESNERLRHEKELNKWSEKQAQQEYEIIRRKNLGQSVDGSYDGQPVYQHSRDVSIGPFKVSVSDSEPSYKKAFFQSAEWSQFLLKNIPRDYVADTTEIVDGRGDKNLGERMSDSGYIQVAHIGASYNGTYVLFLNRNTKRYVIVQSR